jgi:hypothetical protein
VPRPKAYPETDALLSATEACGLVHVSRSRWDAYARRFPALVRGRRIVRANPGGNGVARWLRSALVEHMHDELERDRAPEPAEVPVDAEGAS